MDAECINERIEHDLSLCSILSKKRCYLLDSLKGALYDILRLLHDCLSLDGRIRYVFEHGAKKPLLINKEECDAQILVLEVNAILSRACQIELLAEFLGEWDEAFKRKPLDHREHRFVDESFFHVSEHIEEYDIAIRNLQIAVNDDNTCRNR